MRVFFQCLCCYYQGQCRAKPFLCLHYRSSSLPAVMEKWTVTFHSKHISDCSFIQGLKGRVCITLGLRAGRYLQRSTMESYVIWINTDIRRQRLPSPAPCAFCSPGYIFHTCWVAARLLQQNTCFCTSDVNVCMLMFISITFIGLVRDSSHISAYSKVMRSAVLLPDSTYFWLKLDFALGHTDGWEIKGEKKNPDLYSEGIQWLWWRSNTLTF